MGLHGSARRRSFRRQDAGLQSSLLLYIIRRVLPAQRLRNSHQLVPVPLGKIMGDASEGGMPQVGFFERQLAARILDTGL